MEIMVCFVGYVCFKEERKSGKGMLKCRELTSLCLSKLFLPLVCFKVYTSLSPFSASILKFTFLGTIHLCPVPPNLKLYRKEFSKITKCLYYHKTLKALSFIDT